MPGGKFREVILNLKRAVAQLVVRRKGLKSKGGVRRGALEDVYERKYGASGSPAFVLIGIATLKRVGHRVAYDGVPLADPRPDVLKRLIGRIHKAQEGRGA